MFKRSSPILATMVLLVACETAPVAPTVIESPRVAPVATAQPYVWDSAEELAAWVTVVSTGAISLSGEGAEAVIRVDVGAGAASLHGPEFDPPLVGIRSVTMRYRWVEGQEGDSLSVSAYFRESGATSAATRLDPPVSLEYLSSLRSGAWQERTLKVNASGDHTFTARFALVRVASTPLPIVGRATHGVVEIDWIKVNY
jgi:hypothetical protein